MTGKGTPKQQKRAANSAMGLNSAGEPDPTKNVIALNEASVYRQDDLREAFEKYVNVRLECVKEIDNLRAKHAEQLSIAEAKRIDAVRSVDVAAVKTEADRALAAIQTLAAQTAVDRETLRTAVATTAQAIAKQTADDRALLSERIAALEKTSYEGHGKGVGYEKVWGWIVAAAGSGGVLAYLAAHFSTK